MKNLIVISVVALLTGCSTASSIQKASESKSAFDDAVFKGVEVVVNTDIPKEDAYRIFHQAATGFVSIQSIRASAEKRGSGFCKRQNKQMYTLSERTSSPPYILGNFPRIEIIFSCKQSDENNSGNNIGKYEQIKQLKELMDSGAITSEEFKNEKVKLLSKE